MRKGGAGWARSVLMGGSEKEEEWKYEGEGGRKEG